MMRELDWSARIRIMADIARALNYMHRAKDVRCFHRDVKSANVVLDLGKAFVYCP